MSSIQLLDFIATFAFALVGSRVAASKNMDYGGITFVAAVTALSVKFRINLPRIK